MRISSHDTEVIESMCPATGMQRSAMGNDDESYLT